MAGSGTTSNSLLRRLVSVRAGELQLLMFAFAYFFFLMGGYAMLRPVRDQMAIARGVENLKFLFLYTFIAMLLAAPLYGAVVARAAKARIVPVVYRFFILNLAAFWAFIAISGEPARAGTAFFVWLSVFNLFVVSVFWSLLNDLFSTDRASGSSPSSPPAARWGLGWAYRGCTPRQGHRPGPSAVVGDRFSGSVASVHAFPCPHERPEPRSGGRRPIRSHPVGHANWWQHSGRLEARLSSPYLAGVALFFLFMTGVATFLYYTQAYYIRAATVDPAERTQIFAMFDIVAQGLTFTVQLFVAGHLFKRFGIGGG